MSAGGDGSDTVRDLREARRRIESARLLFQRVLEDRAGSDPTLAKAVLAQDAKLRDALAGLKTAISWMEE